MKIDLPFRIAGHRQSEQRHNKKKNDAAPSQQSWIDSFEHYGFTKYEEVERKQESDRDTERIDMPAAARRRVPEQVLHQQQAAYRNPDTREYLRGHECK